MSDNLILGLGEDTKYFFYLILLVTPVQSYLHLKIYL
jgi:hypothetical protein